jgi:asparagine synthase (glutamine-hydrolysing)
MCGICGVIGDGRGDLAESRVRKMMGAMLHRGPDEDGILLAPRAALGMRRLSIIDLAGGQQPAYNEDGTVGVVFNGEIYNFPELRVTLETCGHRFRTHSDTEVIVHAYEEWGQACLEQLRGMFAFALWDGREKSARVLLARDRLGIKPLYYAFVDGALLFASEVRALLASGVIPRRVAPQSVEAYLLFGSVVEPMTLVEGVLSLLPGHALMVSCDSVSDAKSASYWDLAAAARTAVQHAPKTLAEAGREVRPLLDEAVRSHLLADVPLGLFLSSGLDSTALTVLASRERKGLHTFTVVFPEQQFSEAPIARETAKTVGTEHRELMLNADDMLARLSEAVGALDQPSMDGVNTFFVSWAARQVGLKVALSGLGGDEVFGGYTTFRTTPQLATLAMMGRYVPSVARKPMAAVLTEVGHRGNHSRRSDIARKLAAVWREPDALPHPYFYTRMLFTPGQIELLFSSSARDERRAERAAGSSPWRGWLEQTVQQAEQLEGDSVVSYLELRTYMLDTLLRDTDSMSMHHSLEVRVPLLDHPLVEYVSGLPTSAKRRDGVNKALLVEALGDLLPSNVITQPKRTFTFPWENWLHGPLGAQVAAQLGKLTPSLAAIFDGANVETIWRSFQQRRTGWARPWSLFVLNEWVRCHLDDAESSDETVRSAAGATAS